MNRWKGKVAVVTGASSGTGCTTAQALVREGMVVVGLDKIKENMEKCTKLMKGSGKFYTMKCDVSKAWEVTQAFERIKKYLGTVHVLVNSAGIIKKYVTIADMKTKDMNRIFDTNVMGLLHCCRQAITIMNEGNHEAHIINISSIASQPNIVSEQVFTNVYGASKCAVTGISDTLRVELLGEKIRVTTICPGGVNTPFVGFFGRIAHKMGILPFLEAGDIADAIVYVIAAPQHVQITDLIIRPFGEIKI